MSDETDGVDAVESPDGVNGGDELSENVDDPGIPAEPGSSKLNVIEFKSELKESPVRKDIITTSAPKQAIRVKRELVSFDTQAADRSDEAEVEKLANASMMVQFPTDWTCTTCGYEFSTLTDLQAHQPACRFPVTRAHICDICQESFERKSDLNNHIVCHQVNRPHACRMCGSLFRKKGDLLSHMVTHQVDKPHKCSTCGLEFQRHSSLTNHMKIHSYAAGRALIPSIYSNTKPIASPTQIAASAAIKRNQAAWQAPERSTEPIPSFETLPVPGYAYYNNLASSNYTSFLAGKTINNAVLSSKHGNPEISTLIPPTDDTPNAFPTTSASATQITCLPDISQSTDVEPHGDLSTDFQIAQQQFPVEEQTEFDNVPEVESNEPDNQTLTSYLTVKNAGLLYGIKIEGQYNQQEMNSQQQSVESPEQQTLSESQPEENVVQHMQGTEHGKLAPSPPSLSPISNREVLNEATKPHMCQFCGIYFARQKAFQSHMRLHDDNWEPTYRCQVCGQNFPDYVALNLHTSKCMRASRRDDEFSPAETVRDEQEVAHNQTFPPVRQTGTSKQSFKHICVTCDKRFATKQKLFRHMWIHRKKLFTCEACGDVFDERDLLDKHRLEIHPPNESTPYACQTCGKSFTSRQTLWEHGRVHGGTGSGAALLWCQECNKSFASRQGYQIHTRTHTGERPYGCRYCMKSFRDGGTLRKHERIHTGERPHVCPLCMRAFNQKVVLREHVRWVHAATATGEPPLRCLLCATSVPDREALCAHIVKHSDEMASEARAATKSANNLKPRRPPRKSSKVLVQAVDGKFVSVEKDDLEKASNSTIETVAPTSTVTSSESMDDSSHSTPESPFNFPKIEPQSTDMPSTSAMDCSESFMFSNDAGDEQTEIAVGQDLPSPEPPAAAKPQSPENSTVAQSSPGEKLDEDGIPIPGFIQIGPTMPPAVPCAMSRAQSLTLDEAAPNVTIADIPNSQYHLISQDVNLPPTDMETEIQDPMSFIQVVTDINSNPQDVMAHINLVSEQANVGKSKDNDDYFDQSGEESFVQKDDAKDNSERVRCEVCHEEFAGTAILMQHVETHV